MKHVPCTGSRQVGGVSENGYTGMVVLEKRWEMFEGRAVQVARISLLSTDEVRGASSIQCECFGFVVMFVAAASWLRSILL